MPPHSRFGKAAVSYDLMVNWEKRLGREGPLFRKVFDEAGARR
jgi:hypothetical protein